MTGFRSIVLLRHFECEGRGYTGSGSDVPLTAEGMKAAARSAEHFKKNRPDKIFCSPLQRCRQTAAAVEEACGLGAEIRTEISEIDFGRWEGLSYSQIEESEPELLSAWLSDPLNSRPPGGESLSELYGRVGAFWSECIESDRHANILLVTHGGPIRTMLSTAAGGGPAGHWAFNIERGSLSEIRIFGDGRCIINRINMENIE